MDSDSGCIPSSIWDLPEDEALEAAGLLSACEQLLPLPLGAPATAPLITNGIPPSHHLQSHAFLPIDPIRNQSEQHQGLHAQLQWQPVAAGPDPAYAAAVQAAMGLINPKQYHQNPLQNIQRAPSAHDQAAAAPATSASPGGSSSGGNQAHDDMLEVAEQRRKSQNRGALAQKRFRERQKVSGNYQHQI